MVFEFPMRREPDVRNASEADQLRVQPSTGLVPIVDGMKWLSRRAGNAHYWYS